MRGLREDTLLREKVYWTGRTFSSPMAPLSEESKPSYLWLLLYSSFWKYMKKPLFTQDIEDASKLKRVVIVVWVIQRESHPGRLRMLYCWKVSTFSLLFKLLHNFKERRDTQRSLEVCSPHKSSFSLLRGMFIGSLSWAAQVWVITAALFPDNSVRV